MVCNATLTHGVVPQDSDSLGQLAARPAAGLHRLSIETWLLLSLNMMIYQTPSALVEGRRRVSAAEWRED